MSMGYVVVVIVSGLNGTPVETRYPMPNREKCVAVAKAVNSRQGDSNRMIGATCSPIYIPAEKK